ncbi:MAG: hypothetical protein H6809_07485 [Phycisphaeraceae bacterium]|nr:hypothetical protein [Phycisphaeraceae bacterium]
MRIRRPARRSSRSNSLFVAALLASAAVALTGTAPALAQTSTPTTFPTAQPGGDPAAPFACFPGDNYDPDVPSPEAFLGYPLGSRFTRHHDVIAYLNTLADLSDRIVVREYGRTHEDRGLVIATISSPENLANLEDIKAANRRLADPAISDADARAIIDANPSIAWLSFSVHGNEASTVEAALISAYTLAAAEGPEADELRRNCVVVIDPCINPDGRSRYVAHYEQTVGRVPNPMHAAAEHHEPWPGGRTNHYFFDLNRDWLWLTQPESRARVAAYREYLPHLHVDNHEQGYSSPFFFGAGEKPYNQNIPAETVEWVHIYGGSGADRFDADGLLFATEERFDYLYPGYGKVLPCYQGAVGLLNEKAGHGFAGVAVEVTDSHTLTLLERTRHHFILNMAFVQTTADRRAEQLARFRRFFTDTVEHARANAETYFILPSSDPEATARMVDLCRRQGIVVERLTGQWDARGLRSYRTGEATPSSTLPNGTLVVRTDQALGRLARALFERSTFVEDNETYDITAWSLPISFGLDAAYSDEEFLAPVRALRDDEFVPRTWPAIADAIRAAAAEQRLAELGPDTPPTAWLIDTDAYLAPALLGRAIELELSLRIADEPIAIGDTRFPRGSIIAHRLRNDAAKLADFLAYARALGLRVAPAATGLTDEGPALGNNANTPWDIPRIALIRGGGDSYSFGHHWFLLDQEFRIPHTAMDASQLSAETLAQLNVIVLPDATTLPGSTADRVRDWVRAGGTLIASGSAASWASGTMLELSDSNIPGPKPEDRPAPSTLTFEQRRERQLEDAVPGAMLAATLDATHPLTVAMRPGAGPNAGASPWIGVLKDGGRRLPVGDSGYVVARFDQGGYIGGLISERNRRLIAGTPFMTHHSLGRGNIICLSDDVTNRAFLLGPRRLLLNAILLGPSL